jgi:hypothetical protein
LFICIQFQILTKDGSLVKTLLTKEDGIRRPQSLAINHSGDKLFVTNSPPYKSDMLLLFDLEYAKVTEDNQIYKKKKSVTCSIT